MKTILKLIVGLSLILIAAAGTSLAVHKYQKPDHMDVIAAQSMDMSDMRPPTGSAPVTLATVRAGSLSDTVTYTGTVRAYNEQDVSTRITGTLLALSAYPGDTVRTGEIVARLDTSQVGPEASEAAATAQEAAVAARTVTLTHHLHHAAALDQATAQEEAAEQNVADAQAEALVDQSAIRDALAGEQSAQATADYWSAEIEREKTLAEAGAVSQQEYQNELSQALAAAAASRQAADKVTEAEQTARSGKAKAAEAQRQVRAAQAGVEMAKADLSVALQQISQADSAARAASAAAQEAANEEGYSRIASPADGVVTDRPVAPGTLVQAGTILLRIAEIDRVRVQANVAVDDLSGIQPGSPVAIVVQGDRSRIIHARVTAVFPAASEESRTAVVEAVVPNPGHRLIPGAFVTMQIGKSEAASGLMVPSAAIVSQGGQSFLWTVAGSRSALSSARYRAVCGAIYSADFAREHNYICPMDHKPLTLIAQPGSAQTGHLGTAHEAPVRPIAVNGAWTLVQSGAIDPGSRVVTSGQDGLMEGAQVADSDGQVTQ